MPSTSDPTVETLTNVGGDDDDSLFGSPPSSPARGRSPSPLALPGGSGSAQNVGALALPGSHLVAELPTNPPASLPLSASASAPTRQPSVPRIPSAPAASQSGPPSLPRTSSSRISTPGPPRLSRSEPTSRKTRKGKEKERSNTPRPTPPPIALPSPDEPTPPNFLRNQQALLGLAGMVGGVNPANLARVRHTRGTTAENPIVVEDEPEIQPQPSIGKSPVQPSPLDPSQLPKPTAEQILGTLLKQKNIFPVLVSLLRLLAPGAPSLASVPPGYPYYPYPYPYAAPYAPPESRAQPLARSQTPSQSSASDSRPSTSSGAPPLKRRKLNSVPAGAADWDVPYPFQEGQGPENYRASWEQTRGKQLLKDLVQLVHNAARKAATKAWYTQHGHPRYAHAMPSVLKYYRPATLYYGLERGQSAPPLTGHAQIHQHVGSSRSETPGRSTPRAGAPYAYGGGLPHVPAAIPPSAAPARSIDGVQQPPNAFDQLVESLLAAQRQQQQRQQYHQQQHEEHQQSLSQQKEQASGSAAFPGDDPSSSTPVDPSVRSQEAAALSVLDDSTQAFFDNWLQMLTAFPPGDPNDSSGVLAAEFTAATATVTNHVSPISDDMIDPALLGLQSDASRGSASGSVSEATEQQAPLISPVPATSRSMPNTTTSSTAAQPATPSLVDSPSITASSLADPADRDGEPAPSWDWTFSDAQEEMKMLGELAGMPMDVDLDVDLDAAMREALSEWEAGVGMAQSVDAANLMQGTAVEATEEGRVAKARPAEGSPCQAGAREENALGDGAQGPVTQQPSAQDDDPRSTPQVDSLDSQRSHLGPLSRSAASTSPANTSIPSIASSQAPNLLPARSSRYTAPLPAPLALVAPLGLSTRFSTPVSSATPTSCTTPVPPPVPVPVPYPSAPPASARAKGKAKAIPGTGHGVVPGPLLGSGSGIGGGTGVGAGGGMGAHRRAVVARARELRAALAKEVERAKVALWETTLEQGVLVGLGRELEKGAGTSAGAG